MAGQAGLTNSTRRSASATEGKRGNLTNRAVSTANSSRKTDFGKFW